jgi:uncharacterized protein
MSVMSDQEDNTLAVITHILGLFVSFVGPLFIYFISEEGANKDHARNAMNWQFSFLIYLTSVFAIMFMTVYSKNVGRQMMFWASTTTFLSVSVLVAAHYGFCFKAAIRAGKNQFWKYPGAIPFFKIQSIQSN